MESEEQVKKLLSCLIISSPKAMSVRRLQQDYQSEIGKNVPYKSFGYDTLEKYLLSIPDVCQINGTGPMAIVEPVIGEKVKHINNMIIKQKTLARPKGIEVKPQPKTVRFAVPLSSRDLLNRCQTPLLDEACGYTNVITPMATYKDLSNDANTRLRATSQDVRQSDRTKPETNVMRNFHQRTRATPQGNFNNPCGSNARSDVRQPGSYLKGETQHPTRKSTWAPNATGQLRPPGSYLPARNSNYAPNPSSELCQPGSYLVGETQQPTLNSTCAPNVIGELRQPESYLAGETQQPTYQSTGAPNAASEIRQPALINSLQQNNRSLTPTSAQNGTTAAQINGSTSQTEAQNDLAVTGAVKSNTQEPERKPSGLAHSIRMLRQKQILWEKKKAEDKAREENQAGVSNASIPQTNYDLSRVHSESSNPVYVTSDTAVRLDPMNDGNHPNKLTASPASPKVPIIVQMSETEYVTRNLRLLIQENPTGIWSSQLIHYYKRRFNDSFDPVKFGFKTMNDFCETLTEVFVIIRLAGGDWKLFDVRNPPLHLLTQEKTSICDLYGNNVPENVMLLGDVIEQQWLPKDVSRGMYVDIVIGEVFNPHKFYIQFTREDDYSEKFLDDMEAFYGRMHVSYRLHSKYIEDGLYCVAHFRGQFNRGIIQSRVSEDTVIVYSIDFGTAIKVNLRDMYFMSRQFNSLPQQAIRSRLSCISPKNGTSWPYEASRRFFDLCYGKDLVGNLNYIDECNQILYLVVTDITNANDIHINDTLIDEGYAVLDFSRH